MERSETSFLRPRVVVLISQGDSAGANAHLDEVERMGVQCVCVTSANEAAAEILGAKAVALLVDLRATGWREARVLQIAHEMNLEILAFSPETNCDDLSGLKLVAGHDIPAAIKHALERSQTETAEYGQWEKSVEQQRPLVGKQFRVRASEYQRVDESMAMREQLSLEIAGHKRSMRRLELEKAELRTANEQLGGEIARKEQAIRRLEREVHESASAYERVQHELARGKEAEGLLELRISELTGTCERLEGEVSEHDLLRKELQEYRDVLERRMKKQSDELAAVCKRLNYEITERGRVEESLREKKIELSAANKQLQRSRLNMIINVGLIIGLIILIISQLLLFTFRT